MSVYMTEEEQLEAIKKWWQRYSTPILIILSLIMLAIAGYRYYSWHQEKVQMNASITYERMMLSFSNQNSADVTSFANDLIQHYPDHIYADVARLLLAKQKISNKHPAKAIQYLKNIVQHAKNPVIRQIARTRLARIQLADKHYDQALAVLAVSDDPTFEPVVAELTGDIYMQMGDGSKARAAYQKAIDLTSALELPNMFLEMKVNEVLAGQVG